MLLNQIRVSAQPLATLLVGIIFLRKILGASTIWFIVLSDHPGGCVKTRAWPTKGGHTFAKASVRWPDAAGMNLRPTTDCVSLGKLLHLSGLLLFHLKNGIKLQSSMRIKCKHRGKAPGTEAILYLRASLEIRSICFSRFFSHPRVTLCVPRLWSPIGSHPHLYCTSPSCSWGWAPTPPPPGIPPRSSLPPNQMWSPILFPALSALGVCFRVTSFMYVRIPPFLGAEILPCSPWPYSWASSKKGLARSV